MDIRARDLLSKIKDVESSSFSIIAGGAARDEYLNKPVKDYDFYIPSTAYKDVCNILKGIDASVPENSYPGEVISEVLNISYEGIPCQLIFSDLENADDFPQRVLNTFDYGICKIYYEGSSILVDSEEFNKDAKSKTMTLYRLDHISHLPKAITRFNYLNKKLGGFWEFRCPLLELKDDGTKTTKLKKLNNKTATYAKLYGANLDRLGAEIERDVINDFVAQRAGLGVVQPNQPNLNQPRPQRVDWNIRADQIIPVNNLPIEPIGWRGQVPGEFVGMGINNAFPNDQHLAVQDLPPIQQHLGLDEMIEINRIIDNIQ